jgi:dihydroxyacetone kinase-like predicted kinase
VTVDEPSELSEYRYCTSFLITGDAVDREAFEAFLLPLGDSALVVGDERTVKVHVHVNDPGVVLSEALRHGSIGDVEINDMHVQTRERDERLSTPAPAQVEIGDGGCVVVAVVAGAGNQQLFRELGCHAVVDGGQSMNPSAAQLLEAVEALGVDEVVVLPNNGNVILTAEQAAGMSSLHIAVVPSRSIPSGLAAMVAFDPDEDAVGNARLMQDAIADVRYAEVTHAVRDSELDGLDVKKGQAMAIVDGRLVAAADDVEGAFGGVLEEFARGGAEYVTVLTALNGSSGTTREQLEELAARVAPDAEVSFHEGGQPLYPILASAE